MPLVYFHRHDFHVKFTQAVKINKKTRFYALKCALLTFCNAFFSKKRRLNG